MADYRNRIYNHYVSGAHPASAPRLGDDRASREPTMRYLISECFPPDRSAAILDLGCGHGTLVHFARQAGYERISGVDASPQQVALARELGIHGVQHGDVLDTLTRTPAATLDAIVAFDVIEHLTKGELIGMADAAWRALKPNGVWIIHTVNAASPFFGAVRYGDLTHEQAFTPDSLRQLAGTAGFARIAFAECRPRVHGAASLARALLWRAIRFTFRAALAVETGETSRPVLTQNFYAIATK
jgi:2-polyprenyl-3-methyl-5-hydroxy-6-metoxy-1,4-benzoquinol methylase